jgi:hypothetical protein
MVFGNVEQERDIRLGVLILGMLLVELLGNMMWLFYLSH